MAWFGGNASLSLVNTEQIWIPIGWNKRGKVLCSIPEESESCSKAREALVEVHGSSPDRSESYVEPEET